MLRLRNFQILFPETLEQAVDFFNKYENSIIIAGGTDLLPKLKRRQFEPNYLISLSKIENLSYIKTENSEIKIGPTTTLREIENNLNLKGLQEAIRLIATPVIRNTATIGGNLFQDTRCRFYDKSYFWRKSIGFCLKKEGTYCQVAPSGNRCYAVFCSDLAPVLIALESKVRIIDFEKNEKEILLKDLYQDDGKNHLKIKGILKEIIIPLNGIKVKYKKLRIRETLDFPETGVAVGVKKINNKLKINISISAVSSGIFFKTEEIGEEEIERIADEIYNLIKPVDNLYFPPLYRKKIARKFVISAFRDLISEL